MNDPILASFLEHQYRESSELASKSDLFDLTPVGHEPYQLYVLRFYCKGLVRSGEGVVVSEYSQIAVRFPDDYLRRVHPSQVLAWWKPVNAFHPAIEYPFICPGHLYPSESFVEIIHQCFDIITWKKVNMNEFDALTHEAAAWARSNQRRFPIDPRPLVHRRRSFKIGNTSTVVPSDAARGEEATHIDEQQKTLNGD